MPVRTRFHIRFLIYLSASFILAECNDSQNTQATTMKSLIEDIDHSNKIAFPKYCLIIPVDGCGECFEKSMEFCKANLQNDRFLFVFTSLSSLKDLKEHIDPDQLTAPNVIQDREGKIAQNFKLDAHIWILQVIDERAKEIIELTPENIDSMLEKLIL